jgi:hypothetical protein
VTHESDKYIEDTQEMRDLLRDCLAFFAKNEDASLEGERYVPNDEMRLAQRIRELIGP